ncbi:hypothetical protein AVEN_11921-1 [Araneus ventricosus]|uniref:Uncharacterized protein n=1 Tax=Araneus ventricosus TaxID=182803 RepID=A0A4Y2EW49_ARAVE|nr:hypothetical protein AVEN_11921-1 [Araneus ventricosus]
MRLQLSKGAYSSQRLASIPRGLRTPVTSAEISCRDSDFSIFSNHSISKIQFNLLFLSKTPNFKLLHPASMRRGRKVKSQGFVGLLTAASNRKPRSLSHLIIRRGSEPKVFL